MNYKQIKEWATPLAIGSFVLSAATGIPLFFHLEIGWVKSAHTWFSWIFLAGAIGHAVANRKSVMLHLNKPIGRAIVGLCLVATLASFVPLGGGAKGGNPFMGMSRTLAGMPLTEIAQVVKKSPDVLIADLRAKNIAVAEEKQTVLEIAKQNNRKDIEVLFTIFGQDRRP